MRRIVSLPLVVALPLVLAACSGGAPPPPPKPHVSAAIPLKRQVVDWDDYVGRFEAVQDVEIRPRISGAVESVNFREGVEVAKGQVLFTIDPRPYRAAAEQARADLAKAQALVTNARTELARAQKLVDAQAISREEFETKEANLRSAVAAAGAARANLEAKSLDLSFTTVRSPISGRVSDKRVSIGTYVSAGQTVLTRVVTVNPIRFAFEGAETFYLKYVRQAQAGERESSRYAPNPVDIKLADETSYRWHGLMKFVDNAIDRNSGTIRAFAEVDNPTGFLVPGMFGRARLLGSGTYGALLVPDEAIVTDQTRRFVYVVGSDGKSVQRNVETGPLVEGLRVVKTGLAPTEKVILDGLARLQPGMAVDAKIITMKPRAAADSPASNAIAAPAAAEATAK
ncbi:MexE family multidrug efflux RND transporter periplasmic adaptor subunit [Novosphingobium sediminis]|uniref:MexE family multidrug efflux RND transporter periplasmic adaptor subunit n=1 Tax=Novosphingobium sediminis TaxID=707214 RepID=A0A512AFY1_9SPHN|nr:efflux RND transporter periplasmic adaptor subunit [Novosphingobium sediminis]GEN98614.1 MexE family multidrug efflux RND transporter periplasmic adaptor subunit [Novosphingobium sediminis]